MSSPEALQTDEGPESGVGQTQPTVRTLRTVLLLEVNVSRALRSPDQLDENKEEQSTPHSD